MADLIPGRERLSQLLDRGNIVKICGLREPEHAAAAVSAGADFIGFVFAPARRQVTPATARQCIAAARAESHNRPVVAIGVFVDASPTEILDVVREAGIDAVQLNGAETPEYVQRLSIPAIKALRPRPGEDAKSVFADLEPYRLAGVPPIGFLIDGYAEGAAGGTGARADWGVAASICAKNRVLLGGGLNPENVGAAIRLVRPLGVDVSSGVEIDGAKDTARIEAFILEARAAFRG